jgi:two-component system chemotaxis response regulator CheB
MPRRDVVVVAASAGGIEALRNVLAGIPPDFDAAICVVLHLSATSGVALPMILDRSGPLPAAAAHDGERLCGGRIYVCVADHHLLLSDGHLHVRRGPRENGYRPAADPLFRSAARYFGPRAIGVVLSGTLSDGAAGLAAIRREGGLAVVQDPHDALYPGMPNHALEWVNADYVVPATEIGPLLARLIEEPVDDHGIDLPSDMRQEVAIMEEGPPAVGEPHPGTPSQWPCPDCNGVLWEVDDPDVLRFRCRVGHAWSGDSLLDEQRQVVENALWMALRSMEDRAELSRALAERAQTRGRVVSAERFRENANQLTSSAEVLRRLLGVGETFEKDISDHDAG